MNLGHRAINVGAMNVADLARRPPGNPSVGEIPVRLLGQVAADRVAQGIWVGCLLMPQEFENTRFSADEAGCHAILLDVVSGGGSAAIVRRTRWREDFGFQNLASNKARMFMTINQVREFVCTCRSLPPLCRSTPME